MVTSERRMPSPAPQVSRNWHGRSRFLRWSYLATLRSSAVLGPVLGALVYQGMRGYLVTSDIFKDIQLSVSGVLLLLIVLFIPAGAVGWFRRRIPAWRRVLA